MPLFRAPRKSLSRRKGGRSSFSVRHLPCILVSCCFLLLVGTLNNFKRNEMKDLMKTTDGIGTQWGNIRVELERVRRGEFRGSGRALEAVGFGLTAAGVDGNKAAPDGYGNGKIGDASPGGIESEGNLVPDGITTVAYAISLTACGKQGNDSGPGLTDGAAVLAHSIRSVSYPAAQNSRYFAKMIAFVHPDAAECSGQLERLGYETITVPTPVVVEEIQGKFLREHVNKTGCCGEKEFIKLYAYTLTDYSVAVHLDLDFLVLKPMDDLFDVMLAGGDGTKTLLRQKVDGGQVRVHVGPHAELNYVESESRVDAFFTRDYNMIHPGKKHVGVQGGFLILRPSRDAFAEYIKIIKEGNFRGGSGWDGKYGGFYGAQQFQGIVPYFYDSFHPGTGVELNRCYYNAMVDAPRDDKGKCRDGTEKCEDCREASPDDIFSAHFTICQKPWNCLAHDSDSKFRQMCRNLTGRWFQMRKDLEDSWIKSYGDAYSPVDRNGKYIKKHFLGFCETYGNKGYVKIVVPS